MLFIDNLWVVELFCEGEIYGWVCGWNCFLCCWFWDRGKIEGGSLECGGLGLLWEGGGFILLIGGFWKEGLVWLLVGWWWNENCWGNCWEWLKGGLEGGSCFGLFWLLGLLGYCWSEKLGNWWFGWEGNGLFDGLWGKCWGGFWIFGWNERFCWCGGWVLEGWKWFICWYGGCWYFIKGGFCVCCWYCNFGESILGIFGVSGCMEWLFLGLLFIGVFRGGGLLDVGNWFFFIFVKK